jgi:hypothetical protein
MSRFLACGLLWAACAGDISANGTDSGVPCDGQVASDGLVASDSATSDAEVPCAIDVDRDGACMPWDCDDENAAIGPSQSEVCHNGLDDNCNGEVDEGCLGTDLYYVDRDSIGGACDDDNPGTESEPWCTIAEANSSLTAGQTVYVRAGTYTDETIQPANSGTSDAARIAYAAYPGEVVTFTGSVYCVRLQSRSYITIIGFQFIDCERNLYLQASDHNNIGYCTFDTPAGPATWAGSRIYDGSSYNRVFNSTFSRYGAQSGADPDYQDYACNLDIGNDNTEDQSDNNLVVNSTFFYGGHHILGVYSNNNVIRGNTFHNEEWYPCHRSSIGGMCGNRDVILNTSQPDTNTRNVIEDNAITFAGVPPDQVSSTGLSLRTQYNMVRRNRFYYCDSAGVTLSADDGNNNDASNNYIYHNVFYKNGYLLFDDWDPRKVGLLLARWVDNSAHNAMTGVAIRNNIFHENQLGAIYYYYVDEGELVVADNWEEGGDPGFTTIGPEPDPFDFDALDFHLRDDSPCVNNGGFLSTATGAGENSTTLVVADAGYFFAGHGVVEADLVQLEEQSTAVAITAVDYASNTLTLAEPLTWADGDGVSLPYHGSRPDQGAYENRND